MKAAIAGLAVLALAACEDKLEEAAGPASADDAVVARVDGEPIYQSNVDAAYESLPPNYKQIPKGLIQDALVQQLVDRRLVASAAVKAGVDQTADFKQRMAEQRETVLNQLYLSDRMDAAMTDDRVAAAYDKIVAEFTPSKEIKARHILVETEDEAKEIIAELDNGADFAELAEAKSIGPSAERGGDLGYFTEGTMVQEFSDAAFALEPGTYTKEPVKTQFGWHVILVEEARDSSPPPLEEVEPEIRRRLQGEVIDEIIAGLREGAEIDVVGEEKGDAAPAADDAPAADEAPAVEEAPADEAPAEDAPAEESGDEAGAS